MSIQDLSISIWRRIIHYGHNLSDILNTKVTCKRLNFILSNFIKSQCCDELYFNLILSKHIHQNSILKEINTRLRLFPSVYVGVTVDFRLCLFGPSELDNKKCFLLDFPQLLSTTDFDTLRYQIYLGTLYVHILLKNHSTLLLSVRHHDKLTIQTFLSFDSSPNYDISWYIPEFAKLNNIPHFHKLFINKSGIQRISMHDSPETPNSIDTISVYNNCEKFALIFKPQMNTFGKIPNREFDTIYQDSLQVVSFLTRRQNGQRKLYNLYCLFTETHDGFKLKSTSDKRIQFPLIFTEYKMIVFTLWDRRDEYTELYIFDYDSGHFYQYALNFEASPRVIFLSHWNHICLFHTNQRMLLPLDVVFSQMQKLSKHCFRFTKLSIKPWQSHFLVDKA